MKKNLLDTITKVTIHLEKAHRIASHNWFCCK